jgi:hypothetical protein
MMPAWVPSRLVPLLLALSVLSAPTPQLAAQEHPTFKFDGQLRLRGEWDGRTVGIGDDAVVLSRARLGVRGSFAPWIRAYAQLQDARAWGSESNTLTDASADYLDMHQVYAELGTDRIAARLGRQEVALADERLVGAVGWSNTGRSFDGARLLGTASGIAWQAFWMNVAERDSLLPVGLHPQNNQGIDDDGWLIGGFASGTLGGTTAEVTLVVDRQGITEQSYTASLRAHGEAGAIAYDAAAAYQFGPDRSAYFASGKAGAVLGRATLAAQVDYLSGDDDPTDGDIKAFTTLYATNHKFYGIMDYFLAPAAQLDQAGLIDAMLRARFTTGAGWLSVDVHRFAVARERNNERALGTEVDVIGNMSLHRFAGVQVGGGVFVPEPLATQLLPAFANGDDPTYWGYAQLILRWP